MTKPVGGQCYRPAMVERPDSVRMTVEDMPAVHAVLACSLPLLGIDPCAPDHPGLCGSCFAVRWDGRTFFVTAAHVVKGSTADGLQVPIKFSSRTVPWVRIRAICNFDQLPKASDEDTAWRDVAVLVPTSEPDFDGADAQPLNLTGFVKLEEVPIGAPFATAGYPRRGLEADYDERVIAHELYFALGFYRGPEYLRCHKLQFDDEPIAQDPNGVSGSPVFRTTWKGNPPVWEGQFAGMVIQGGPTILRFIDGAVIAEAVLRVARDFANQ